MTEDNTKRDIVLASDPQQGLALIERALTDPNVTPEKLHSLLDFQERLRKTAAEQEANEALAMVIQNMPKIKKNGMIDFSSEKKGRQKPIPYAKFEDIQAAIRPIYEREHFTLTFDSEPRPQGGGLIVHAVLTHRNGHKFRASMPLPIDNSGGKQDVQGMGSAMQYGKRYATGALFNLVFEGEDDNAKRADMQFITLEQAKQINELLHESKSDVLRFLQTFEIAEVQNLTKDNFVPAMNLLRSRLSRK